MKKYTADLLNLPEADFIKKYSQEILDNTKKHISDYLLPTNKLQTAATCMQHIYIHHDSDELVVAEIYGHENIEEYIIDSIASIKESHPGIIYADKDVNNIIDIIKEKYQNDTQINWGKIRKIMWSYFEDQIAALKKIA